MKACKILTSTKDLSHEEWLQYRTLGIGGSDAAAIAGLNPWSSPTAVYADKLGFTQPQEANEAMRQGTDLEFYVAQRFMEATGKKVRRENHMLQSIEHPCMLANVDRMVIGERAGLECKTTSPYNKAEWESGRVPDTYYVQCSHYLAVTGLDKWYLAVLVFSKGFYWYEIERNEDDIAALIEMEEEFWRKVQDKTPPEPDGSEASAAVIRGLYDGSDGGEVVLTGVSDALERYAEITKMQKALKAEAAEIEQKIQLQMGDAHIGRTDGWTASWKPVTSNRFDSKRFRAENPDTYEEYTKSSTSRRFTLKKEAI